jgi:phosphoglycerate dehydrogenase-like enzyme
MTPRELTAAVAVRPTLFNALFSEQSQQDLASLAALRYQEEDDRLSEDEMIALVRDCEVAVTGWGTPAFSQNVVNACPNLKLVAHSAGTIKNLLPDAVWNRGIKVVHAAAAIAPAVAEMTVLLMLMCRRDVHNINRRMHAGEQWPQSSELGFELGGTRVGVIGAGHTGRNVIKLLHGFSADIVVYDPYLAPERASELKVTKASLEDLMSTCPIITVQAPTTPETYHMISREHLAMIQDGALFINTARSHAVDADALYEALKANRFQAALDVFDSEPLAVDSRLRGLPNLVLTPHMAGKSEQARQRQGALIVEQLRLYATGRPLTQEVTRDMLNTMA